MRYLLRTNTFYEHLAKKFEELVLTVRKWQFVYERCGNGSLFTKFCSSLAPFSEREWPLRAR